MTRKTLNRFVRPRVVLSTLLAIGVLYFLLAVPETPPSIPPAGHSAMARPFFWNQDARWDSLEASYDVARRAGCPAIDPLLQELFRNGKATLVRIEAVPLAAAAPEFAQLEENTFRLAPLVGACPGRLSEYLTYAARLRDDVKRQSERWDMNDRPTRETLYRLLYGTRSAVEEAILQAPPDERPPALLMGADEPSATPASTLLGVTIHSGDVLVSRGGAPTSALIARGSDFPGNFSHVALAYVDSASHRLSILESHIERGVTISTPEEYLRDAKLRVMVLRLRSDLPQLAADPMLPHRAATAMLRDAQSRHIPYDFSMDCNDSTSMFCSEVASTPYRAFGIRLWMGMSHISSAGLRSWLAGFGVRHFETQEPSDLEYDPQLRVVAEWSDPEALRKDHTDNAVTEAMLEGAERGNALRAPWYLLPPARIMKTFSAILNFFGGVGPVPEGMSASSALRHEDYAARHAAAVQKVRERTAQFRLKHSYEPPYWEMLRMAREALGERWN